MKKAVVLDGTAHVRYSDGSEKPMKASACLLPNNGGGLGSVLLRRVLASMLVQMLLDRELGGLSPGTCDSEGNTAFHKAVRCNPEVALENQVSVCQLLKRLDTDKLFHQFNLARRNAFDMSLHTDIKVRHVLDPPAWETDLPDFDSTADRQLYIAAEKGDIDKFIKKKDQQALRSVVTDSAAWFDVDLALQPRLRRRREVQSRA